MNDPNITDWDYVVLPQLIRRHTTKASIEFDRVKFKTHDAAIIQRMDARLSKLYRKELIIQMNDDEWRMKALAKKIKEIQKLHLDTTDLDDQLYLNLREYFRIKNYFLPLTKRK